MKFLETIKPKTKDNDNISVKDLVSPLESPRNAKQPTNKDNEDTGQEEANITEENKKIFEEEEAKTASTQEKGQLNTTKTVGSEGKSIREKQQVTRGL